MLVRSIAAAAFFVLAWFACIPATQAHAACAPGSVDVGGYHLWVSVAGSAPITVVFESGNGDDSSVWKDIEPQVRALGVATVTYDREGLGQSELRPGPYRIDDDARALERVLRSCHVGGPLILVAHSYGGFISSRVALEDKHVKGLVFIDATVPSYFDNATVAALLAQYRPQYDEVRAKAPKLAAVLIPIMEAYPQTAKRVRSEPLPLDLPIIDIVAEHSWVKTEQETAAWRKAHADFVAASPMREAVFATGSGHKVMKDQPELVLSAIKRMIARVSATGGAK